MTEFDIILSGIDISSVIGGMNFALFFVSDYVNVLTLTNF